jgi:soluble lytic murein transglycosylase-like protein
VSPAGAVGLCQLLPSTARGLGVDPFVPEQNLVGGARYLRQLLDRYPNRADLALAAYNAGFGNVDRAGPGVPDIPETQLYVQRVLDRFDILAAP